MGFATHLSFVPNSLSPVLRGEGRGEGLFFQFDKPPLNSNANVERRTLNVERRTEAQAPHSCTLPRVKGRGSVAFTILVALVLLNVVASPLFAADAPPPLKPE